MWSQIYAITLQTAYRMYECTICISYGTISVTRQLTSEESVYNVYDSDNVLFTSEFAFFFYKNLYKAYDIYSGVIETD